MTSRARQWTREYAMPGLFASAGDVIETDLAGVNQLIRSARTVGLCTDYLGPREVVRL
jgi:hypothetical protein